VDIEVGFNPAGDINLDKLNNTVNYEQLYDLVCEEMKIARKLIETVAQAIVDQVKQQYDFVDTIQVTIKKLNPLIGAKVKQSVVIINYQKK
jgi:dihydroneopterin aldolase